MTQDEIAALIPANVKEAAAKANYEARCKFYRLGAKFAEWEDLTQTEHDNEVAWTCASLAAGLAAWGGMYVEPETMYGKEIGKTIFLPIEEPTP